jgi:carbonic anhydrase/acetyltransferase-like protein (isoleucine patch superfamily)
MIFTLGDRRPSIHETAFVADSAQVIGSVVLEENSSVWFGAVLRGDNAQITLGPDTNFQDGAIIHTDEGLDVRLGRGVTVGHRVVLHGCQIGDFSLVGIGAVLLNRVQIGKHCLIGAGALITEGKQIPDRSLVLGSPARVARTLTDAEVQHLLFSAEHYVHNGRRYRTSLQPMPPPR